MELGLLLSFLSQFAAACLSTICDTDNLAKLIKEYSQLAKLKKSIPLMVLHESYRIEADGLKKKSNYT